MRFNATPCFGSTFLGGVLAAITLVIAPWTARFYAAPAVTSLLTWMSLGFVLIGTGGFMRAQLYRNMRFHDANRLETISAVAGTIGMVLVGAIAANAYAFVAFLLISEATATGLAWRCQSWRPTQFPAWRSLRPLLRTGRNLTSTNSPKLCSFSSIRWPSAAGLARIHLGFTIEPPN